MAIASNNPYPSVLIVEGTAPSAPAAGQQRLFIDSADHVVKVMNSSSTITPVGGASITNFMAQLGSDATVSSAGHYQDLLTNSCVAGTWLLYATTTFTDTATADTFAIAIYDGSTYYASTEVTTPAANYEGSLSVVCVVVLGGTTTMKLRGTAGATSGKFLKDVAHNGIDTAGNTGTTFVGIKIA